MLLAMRHEISVVSSVIGSLRLERCRRLGAVALGHDLAAVHDDQRERHAVRRVGGEQLVGHRVDRGEIRDPHRRSTVVRGGVSTGPAMHADEAR